MADFLEEGPCCGAAEREAPGGQSWHPQDGKLSADGRAPCMIQPGLAAALNPAGFSLYLLEPGHQTVLEDAQHPCHSWAVDPRGPPLLALPAQGPPGSPLCTGGYQDTDGI